MRIILKLVACILSLHLCFGIAAQESDITESYVNTEKGQIYVRTEGQGQPIVFINGGPGAGHRVFLGWFDFLKAEGYQLVFFDDIGRGRSTRVIEGKFTPQMTVDDLESVRQHLKAERIIVAGHSYGGIPAMQYALQYPQHVAKLLMLNASYDTQSQQMNSDHYFHLLKTLYPEKWQKLQKLHQQGVKPTDAAYEKVLFGSPSMSWIQWYNPANRKKNHKFPSKDSRDRFNIQVFHDIIDEAHGGEIRGTLKGIFIKDQLADFNVDTLITAGRHDNASTPELVYRLYKMLPERMTTMKLFEKSGHWPWVEETELFETTILNFLQGKPD